MPADPAAPTADRPDLPIPRLVIATRESPLALWQARRVQQSLQAAHPGLAVTLLPMTTTGDRFLAASLEAVGGKGSFIKELEIALAEGRADLAVHSMKDVPVDLPPGFAIAALLPPDDPRDAFVSNRFATLARMTPGTVVGTSSLRRQSQLRHLRPDLRVEPLRGNVNTRLRKLDDDHYDAILLAAAGLHRLGMDQRIAEALSPDGFVPAVAQGVIGIEVREGDTHTTDWLAGLHSRHSEIRLRAERAFNRRLGGACHVPVAAHATPLSADHLDGDWRLDGLVAAPDGSIVLRADAIARAADAETLGLELAERLLAGGAGRLLGLD